MSDLNHALFTGVSPSALRAPSIEDARTALEAHEVTCPGTHLDCYGDPAKERARQAWVDQKAVLMSDLEIAKRCATQGWREASPRPAPQPQPIPEPKDKLMPRTKTPQQKLDTMMDRLRTYIAEDRTRLASQLRSQIRAFCDQVGLPCSDLPRNPGKSCGAPVPEDLRPAVHQTEQALAEHLGLPPERVHAASEAATHGPGEDAIPCVEFVRIVRQGIWELMGYLEQIPEAERGESRLVTELSNLDAAAHMAVTFAASGRIEVMS